MGPCGCEVRGVLFRKRKKKTKGRGGDGGVEGFVLVF